MQTYNFKDRLNKLTSLDNIRLLKFIEIFQYCFIYIIIVIIVTHILDKHYFNKFKLQPEDVKKEKSFLQFIKILILIIIEIFVLTIILFYIRKIVLLFPSIGTLYNKRFIPHTTIEYTMHIALIYVFFELIPNFHNRFKILVKYFN